MGICATFVPFGGWWLLAPVALRGLVVGIIHVQGTLLIHQLADRRHAEFALSSYPLIDRIGGVIGGVLSTLLQGCAFARLKILSPAPMFTCGSDIWKAPPPGPVEPWARQASHKIMMLTPHLR